MEDVNSQTPLEAAKAADSAETDAMIDELSKIPFDANAPTEVSAEAKVEAPATAEAAIKSEAETAEEPPESPELQRNLAALKRKEARLAREMSEQRTALQRERDEVAAKQAAVKEFEALRSQAWNNPLGVLKQLGIDNPKEFARLVYLQEKGASDPAHRDTAERHSRQQSNYQEVASLRADIQKMQQQLAANAAQTEARQYIDSVVKGVGEKTPILTTLLSKNPARARQYMARVAQEFAQDLGTYPETTDVVTEVEHRLHQERLELGFVELSKTHPGPGQTQNAGKPLSSQLGNPAVTNADPSDRETEWEQLFASLDGGSTA